MDRISAKLRSRTMSRVGGKNTKPELYVRSALHRAGFRFRLHKADLPGRPDIVLSRFRLVVQVNGCFWHGHDCKRAKLPATNSEFWKRKITANRLRDDRNRLMLEALGWRVFDIWECDLDAGTGRLLRHLSTENDPDQF